MSHSCTLSYFDFYKTLQSGGLERGLWSGHFCSACDRSRIPKACLCKLGEICSNWRMWTLFCWSLFLTLLYFFFAHMGCEFSLWRLWIFESTLIKLQHMDIKVLSMHMEEFPCVSEVWEVPGVCVRCSCCPHGSFVSIFSWKCKHWGKVQWFCFQLNLSFRRMLGQRRQSCLTTCWKSCSIRG